MPADFVRVDLHVHTPASLKDYSGDSTDEQYYSILRNAKDKRLEIIALTDHNSIEGYRTFCSLRDNLSLQQDSLSQITDSHQASTKLSDIQGLLSLFEGILILPGVELTVRPGIHMLVLFNPSTGIPSIERFLAEAGYEPDASGRTDPSAFASWDVIDLLDASKAHDCIVLDAHTDSDKGIWQELDGATRIQCLRSQQLSGLCYKSELQRDNITAVLATPQYRRVNPLAFLRSSDAHTPEDVGSAFTFARLDDLSFESLKRAFSNPLESFSTEEPSTVTILDNLKALENSYGIPKLETEEEINQLLQTVCALNNTDGGYVLLGLTQHKTTVGIPTKAGATGDDPVQDIVKTVVLSFQRLQPSHLLDIPQVEAYNLQNGRVVVSVYIARGTSILGIKHDTSIYYARRRKVVALSPSEIESLVQDRLLEDFHAEILPRIKAVEDDCLQIRNLTVSLPLLRKFEINSVNIRATPVIPQPLPLDADQLQRLHRFPHANGCARGNLFYVDDATPPRLQDAYLRMSLPLWLIQSPVPKAELRETIYITPQGAIYYSKRDYPFHSKKHPIVKLHSEGLLSLYDMRFIASFFKSSFYLWYLQHKYGTTDCMNPAAFLQLRLPLIPPNHPESKREISSINHTVDDIITQERKFLADLNKLFSKRNREHARELVDCHNAAIADRYYAIDCSIYRLLRLSDNEIDVVQNNLKFTGVYLPTAPSAAVDASPSLCLTQDANNSANELPTTLTNHDSPSGTNQS